MQQPIPGLVCSFVEQIQDCEAIKELSNSRTRMSSEPDLILELWLYFFPSSEMETEDGVENEFKASSLDETSARTTKSFNKTKFIFWTVYV